MTRARAALELALWLLPWILAAFLGGYAVGQFQGQRQSELVLREWLDAERKSNAVMGMALVGATANRFEKAEAMRNAIREIARAEGK